MPPNLDLSVVLLDGQGLGGLEEPTELKSHLITSCQRYLLSTRCVPERG